MNSESRDIVVVGGGAGGLGLAIKLSRKYRKDKGIQVILVDQKPTHVWKPLLHEIATGSLDSNHDEISYASLARRHKFRFVLAQLTRVDSANSEILIQPVYGPALKGDGIEGPAVKTLNYSQLVLAIGSQANDFNTKGVQQNAIFLDNRSQAEEFHQRFVTKLNELNYAPNPQRLLPVVIVGGGATGVELSADLHHVAEQLEDYGFERFSPELLSITLIEAGPRLLAQLPERISQSVNSELETIGVSVKTNALVIEITDQHVTTKDGEQYPSDLTVWAAGIQAPSVLRESGLPVDNIGRVIVSDKLQLETTPNVFVLGDCCHCEMADGQIVPPRAQSAHQMAKTVYKNIINQNRGRELTAFVYRDFGSLVSLSEYTTVGNLMGNLMRGSVFIEGWFARIVYRMLYRMHQCGIHGYTSTALIMLGDRIHRATRSHLKLH